MLLSSVRSRFAVVPLTTSDEVAIEMVTVAVVGHSPGLVLCAAMVAGARVAPPRKTRRAGWVCAVTPMRTAAQATRKAEVMSERRARFFIIPNPPEVDSEVPGT